MQFVFQRFQEVIDSTHIDCFFYIPSIFWFDKIRENNNKLLKHTEKSFNALSFNDISFQRILKVEFVTNSSQVKHMNI